MIYRICAPKKLRGSISLPASKSLSNRLLIVKALCSAEINISNLSAAEDTKTLEALLAADSNPLDVGHAGTTMRFLTAYLSTLNKTSVLTGSERMKQRPIGVLVDALHHLGGDIKYLGEAGYPPLQINGGGIEGSEITIKSNVSSQFISALILIAPTLPNGLTIHLGHNVVSHAYIEMTLKVIRNFGITAIEKADSISIKPGAYTGGNFAIEADWSSASYWYAMVALSEDEDAEIELTGLHKCSWQGDSTVADLFTLLGVKTTYTETGLVLTKMAVHAQELGFNFINCPDLAQTLAVTTGALGIPTRYTGLETLKVKETDRIDALKSELKKVGVEVEELKVGEMTSFPSTVAPASAPISTFEDHRMAMSFAPLSCILGEMSIENPGVVGKSYPNFWEDLRSVGFEVKEV